MSEYTISVRHQESLRELIEREDMRGDWGRLDDEKFAPEFCKIVREIIDEEGPTFSGTISRYCRHYTGKKTYSFPIRRDFRVDICKDVGRQYGIQTITLSEAIQRVYRDVENLSYKRKVNRWSIYQTKPHIYYVDEESLEEFILKNTATRIITTTQVEWKRQNE